MLLLSKRNCQLIYDIPEEIKTLTVYGDQLRIQQVLAGFLMTHHLQMVGYLAQLQKNLMYLAAILDAQPQHQLCLHRWPHSLRCNKDSMQHPQVAAMAQQQEGKSHFTHNFYFAFLVCALLVSMLGW
ncbi:hypothetical protein P8452_68605 [Trifolium repens]|nr:hypothetical protein P8452_68605 [Trifolium repens]